MNHTVIQDWVKTLTLAALMGMPLSYLALSSSFGLAHGGPIGAILLIVVVPGIIAGGFGPLGIIAIQIVYYIFVARVIRTFIQRRSEDHNDERAS